MVLVPRIDPRDQMLRLDDDDGGGQALALEADVTAPAAVEAMTQAVVDAYGQLDCALNAAGVGGEGTPLLKVPWERWQQTISINLSGVFLCVQQQLRFMVPAGRGAICNVASIWGLAGTGTDGMIGERQTATTPASTGRRSDQMRGARLLAQ